MNIKQSRGAAAGGIAAAMVVGLLGCTPGSNDPDEPTSVTIAVSSGIFLTKWDYPSVSMFILTQGLVYEPLIVWNPDTNEYDPWLAEAFEISEDGLSITFTVRQGVTFADGTEMDAEAVAKSINTAFTAGQLAYLVPDWGPVATVAGDDTVVVTATKPITTESVPLLQFGTLPIMAPAAIDDPSSVAEEPNGTGPYDLVDVVPEVSATYERNEDYWNPEAVEFDEVTIVAMADKVAALNALKSDQVDAAELDPSMAAEAEAGGLTVDTEAAGLDLLVFLDRIGAGNPALEDVRVRQALSYAIDRAAIVDELLQGYGGTSTQPFDPASTEYVEGGDDRYAYDPDRARELLAEAGYPDGFTFRMPRRTFTTIDYTPVVAQYLEEIGVTIEWIESVDATDLFSRLLSGSGGIDGVVYNLPYAFTIGSYTDHNWWVNQPIDDPELVEIVERYTGDPALHDEALEDYGEYIVENAWYIVLAHPDAIWASSPDIQVNVAGGPLGALLPRLAWFSAPE